MLIHQNNCKIVASTGFENHFLFFVFGINLICKTHFPLSLFTSVNHFHFHELEKNIFPAWAMGASTGHTAVALWRDGNLQVGVNSLKFNQSVFSQICESNAFSPYWPTNGIQCNPYLDWLEVGKRWTMLINQPCSLSLED